MTHIVLGLVVLLSICGATVTSADTIAVEPQPTDSQYRFPRAATLGWGFTVESAAISVTKLGVFDAENDGLAEPHDVGIWDFNSQTLLASAVIPAGAEATLAGGFRYVSIEPTTLPGGPGTGLYAIGAFYREGTADLLLTVDDADDSSALFQRIDLSSSDPQFQFPGSTGRGEDPGHFGPNFQFILVPEPATGSSLAVAFLLAFTFRRCRMSAPTLVHGV